MTNVSYTIRNYQPADFNEYVLLYQDAEKLEPAGRLVSPQAIAERLARPNYAPEQDLLVVTRAGSFIGYLDSLPELGIGRVILECWLHPKHRRKGLATRLGAYAMGRARESGAGVVHVNVMEDNAVAKAVLSRLGFKCVRQFLEFKLDINKLDWSEANRALQACRHQRCGEEAGLVQIQNRCFLGTWGYNLNTLETVTYYTHLSNFSPENVVLAYEEDMVIGYCWTEISCGTDKPEGRICMIGVDPDYRGRGIGRRLLLAGLAHLGNKGVRVARLTVDSENQMACDLYRSVGFEILTSSLWYEKPVTQAIGTG